MPQNLVGLGQPTDGFIVPRYVYMVSLKRENIEAGDPMSRWITSIRFTTELFAG